jgi:probable metal-binding protein
MNEIHGHEVLNMMLASGRTYTKASLVEAIEAKFGAEARFHTCSASGMTAEQLVAFLDAKGKLVPQVDGFRTSANLMCQH